MNFANNLMGVVAPIVTGYILGRTQSFAMAFTVAGVVLLVGAASFYFLLGPIEPIPDPGEERMSA
jgi:ACS family D-galactonate transporter-like MFS transporter